MNRKLFVLLVVLMSLSLMGIIFVQGYWISNSIETKRSRFAYDARQVLKDVAMRVQQQETESYYNVILQLPDSVSFHDYLISLEDTLDHKSYVYRNSIAAEDDKLSAPILDYDLDSVQFARLERKFNQIIGDVEDSVRVSDRGRRFSQYARLNEFERYNLQKSVVEITKNLPVIDRVTKEQLNRLLTMELAEREMETDFEYAIYSNGIATAVHSEGFDVENQEDIYSSPLFVDEEGSSEFQLMANFPGEDRFVVSSIIGMALLSILFTLIIVVAYSSALQQVIKQRQISEIKTDFINNMTHEFKTPIATINLALDAIKNPKIGGNPEATSRYLRMIREENKRMHAQVENVLRISKLEKDQLDIQKERIKLHEVIDDAVTHIELLVENRNGYVKTHFGALKSSILANDMHLTNVIVNLLDNAIKYSPEAPEIDIYTENVKNFILLKVRDKGEGMTKSVQKKIFEKFYREHTGDIHNVKGHGLGLAYVKRIIEDHSGDIWVRSEKGKGSTFIIKLPLIS